MNVNMIKPKKGTQEKVCVYEREREGGERWRERERVRERG